MIKATHCILSLLAMLFMNMGNAQVNNLQESKKDFDERMHWFREAKYGMFIHFGLYSQLGGMYKGKFNQRICRMGEFVAQYWT
ncbi:alpha-L-fucosidase [Sphingobacterium sp. UGAL515B_05]|uniref:alpha-L-fucosidase n=1 Tax=Sphingobacterium sp. UGAL515B_05 TaxID=2986767 RepID=UPI0039859610